MIRRTIRFGSLCFAPPLGSSGVSYPMVKSAVHIQSANQINRFLQHFISIIGLEV